MKKVYIFILALIAGVTIFAAVLIFSNFFRDKSPEIKEYMQKEQPVEVVGYIDDFSERSDMVVLEVRGTDDKWLFNRSSYLPATSITTMKENGFKLESGNTQYIFVCYDKMFGDGYYCPIVAVYSLDKTITYLDKTTGYNNAMAHKGLLNK